MKSRKGCVHVMLVSVCIGSSCHLKGAYLMVESLQQLIQEYSVEDQVELKANFCTGNCLQAVNVKLDEDPCCQVRAEDTRRFFEDHVLRRLLS